MPPIRPGTPPAPGAETVGLIRELAAANRLWGAEHIHGEMLKLDIRAAKSTIPWYLRGAPRRGARGSPGPDDLRNHAQDI